MSSIAQLSETQRFIIMKSFLLELGQFLKPSDRDKFLFKALQKELQLSAELFQEAKLEVKALLPKERRDGIIDLKALMLRIKSDLSIQLSPSDLVDVLFSLREVMNVAGNLEDSFMISLQEEILPKPTELTNPEDFLVVNDEEESLFTFEEAESANESFESNAEVYEDLPKPANQEVEVITQVELPPKTEVIDASGVISLPSMGAKSEPSIFQDFTPDEEIKESNPVSAAQESQVAPTDSQTSSISLPDSTPPSTTLPEIASVSEHEQAPILETPSTTEVETQVDSDSTDETDSEAKEEFVPEGKVQEILFKLKLHDLTWEKLFTPIEFLGPLIRNQLLSILKISAHPEIHKEVYQSITQAKFRLIAALIDGILASYLSLPFFILIGFLSAVLNFIGLTFVIPLFAAIPYFAFCYYYYHMETKYQATFGKQLMGMKITNLAGSDPSKKEILKRNLVRLLPLPFWFLLILSSNLSAMIGFNLTWPFSVLFSLSYFAAFVAYAYVFIQSESRGGHEIFAHTMVAQVSKFPGWSPPKPAVATGSTDESAEPKQ